MATGFTDFGNETVDSPPSGWGSYDRQNLDDEGGLNVESLSGSVSGKALVHNGTGTRAVGALINENITPFADGEIVGLMRFIDPIAGSSFDSPWWMIAGRLEDGTLDGFPDVKTADGVGYGQKGSGEEMWAAGPGSTFEVVGESGFSGTALKPAGTGGPFHGLEDADRYWVRFNYDGPDLKIKVWKVEDPEPGSWAIERDASVSSPKTTAGRVGVTINSGTNSGEVFALEALGWSDDPDVPAPTSAGGGAGGASARALAFLPGAIDATQELARSPEVIT